ncbi:amino acid ABC transporter substrate-binding protein [Roseomonas nepalensis]|uniref:Amino acid ABC transporter substrate-binding protein n=1 Tax=Muricoccus nepalensis TaxID=1854500 RepID=A0A502G3D2_9PROT|nr:amino acid ABC transporter substrate-binding protein [Roseomonas nepalensis]TPG55736.1 amino acid ABC transporter substrate-binding protein [Roseomonas nepalensis]
MTAPVPPSAAVPALRATPGRARRRVVLLALGALASLGIPGLHPASAQESPTLAAIRARGSVVCGVQSNNPPFSLPDSRGAWRGLDVDSCRALAAAVLGDPSKATIRPVTPISRFPAIQSGEIDVLFGSTTWTTTRESSLGLVFAAANYYSGQGFLVKRSLGVGRLAELGGATICVPPGSTTEVVLAEWFRANRLTFQPVLIEDLNEIHAAFLAGRCDAFTRDMTGLSGFRMSQPNPEAFLLLPDSVTMEPLGALIRKGDGRWFDVVRWTQFALIWAEQQGVTAATADAPAAGASSDVRRLLGAEGDIGPSMGLDRRWAANAIKAVGNYGEVWQRNVAPFGLERGLNRLWNEGGLLFSPPLR